MELSHRRRGKPLFVLENLNRGACVGPHREACLEESSQLDRETQRRTSDAIRARNEAAVGMGQAAGLSGTTHYNSPQRDNREAVYIQEDNWTQ